MKTWEIVVAERGWGRPSEPSVFVPGGFHRDHWRKSIAFGPKSRYIPHQGKKILLRAIPALIIATGLILQLEVLIQSILIRTSEL